MNRRIVLIQTLIFAFLMSSVMSFCMSGVVTFLNLGGFTEDYLAAWLFKAFPSGFMVALPVSLFVVPIIRAITTKIMRTLFKEDYPF